MKKLSIITIILLCLNNSLISQNWFEVGSKWHYTHVYFFQSLVDYNLIEVVKDTIIADVECKMITREKISCDLRPFVEYMYEDSGQIFYWAEEEETFKLLYDFSKEVGETWKIDLWYDGYFPPDTDSIIARVDSIKFIPYNGQDLKTMYITYINYEVDYLKNDVLIDKIGSTRKFFPFEAQLCDAEYDINLRCYEDDNLGLINFTTLACDTSYIVLSAEDLNSNIDISISPNPTKGRIFVDNHQESVNIKSVTIFNFQGSILNHHPNISGKHFEIPFTEYLQGIYILQFELDNGQFFSKKIIKN